MKQMLSLMIFAFLFCLPAFAQTENQPCPSIEIVAPPSVVQTGETLFFSASVGSEVKNYDFKYKWSLDKGTIFDGQGTTVIQVATEGLSDTTVTVTFEIEGLPKNCKSKMFETGVIASKLPMCPLDEYDKIPWLDELQRIDSFLAQLSQDSDLTGYVWMLIDEKESVESAKKHIERLIKHIKYRKFAKENIIFAVEKSDNHRTRLIIVPDGAEFPSCENCEIIKGKDFN